MGAPRPSRRALPSVSRWAGMGAASNGSLAGAGAVVAVGVDTARERCAMVAIGAGSAPGARLVRRCVDVSDATTGSSRARIEGAIVGKGGGRHGVDVTSY